MLLELENGSEIEIAEEDLPALLDQLRSSAPLIDADAVGKLLAASVKEQMITLVKVLGGATKEAMVKGLSTAIAESVSKGLAEVKMPEAPPVYITAKGPSSPKLLRITNIGRDKKNQISSVDIEVIE